MDYLNREEELGLVENMTPKEAVFDLSQKLDRTKKGAVRNTANNYVMVLRNDPLLKESLRYNLLACRVDVVKPLWWNQGITALSEEAIDYFYIYLERNYGLSNDKMMDRPNRGIAKLYLSNLSVFCPCLSDIVLIPVTDIKAVLLYNLSRFKTCSPRPGEQPWTFLNAREDAALLRQAEIRNGSKYCFISFNYSYGG